VKKKDKIGKIGVNMASRSHDARLGIGELWG